MKQANYSLSERIEYYKVVMGSLESTISLLKARYKQDEIDEDTFKKISSYYLGQLKRVRTRLSYLENEYQDWDSGFEKDLARAKKAGD